MLWNYRGYGRTEGHPSMPALMKDGEAVFKYVKEVRNSEKVLVHGQSLGGSVACKLGKTADFIFADRTFRSLSDVALTSYGQLAYFIYKLFGPSETDPVKDFLSVDCYKVMSSDPEDAMIPNISSLKAGVIFALSQSKKSRGRDLFKLAKEAVKKKPFKSLVELLKSVHKFKNQRDDSSLDIIGALFSLEVCGRSLYKVSRKKEPEIELLLWIGGVKIWKDIEKEIVSNIEDAEKLVSSSPECEEAQILYEILKTLRELLDEEEEILEDFSGAGRIITLHCGHNNSFQPFELHTYKGHIKAAGMIPR